MRNFPILLVAGVLLVCCSSSGRKDDLGVELEDAGIGDGPRFHGDAGVGDGPRVLADAREAREGDGPQVDVSPDVAGPGCQMLEQGVLIPLAEQPEKFALSMFHFNLQYVAGGLSGWMDRPGLDLDEEQVEDRIILESFEPLLDILLEHPGWGFDLEMQGLMLEVIAERHPVVLEKMRQLVQTGQLHVDSFHYSDQLWVAHPVISMEKSFEHNQRVFQDVCMPLGRAVFTQEGQFGEGLTHHIKESGRVGLLAVNLWKYFQGAAEVALCYEWGGTPVMVVGKSSSGLVGTKNVEVKWHFFDDGELAVTGNANPYFGEAFKYDKAFTDSYVEKLEQLEADGWRIATVADYVDHLVDYGYEMEPLPLVLDGAWQPSDTVNIQRWMGLVGMWDEAEDDNGVLTTLTRSRFVLQAAETLIAAAGKVGEESEEKLEEAWRHQLLGECSDSTGWNPFLGEVDYSREHSAVAVALGEELLAAVSLEPWGGEAMVDTGSGKVTADLAPPVFYELTAGEGLGMTIVCEPGEGGPEVGIEATGWTVSHSWCEVSGAIGYLELNLVPGDDAGKTIRVSFPRDGDVLSYVPALMEGRSEVTQFDVSSVLADPEEALALGLGNGLLGLGDDKWMVTPHFLNHLAVLLPASSPEIVFLDETADNSSTLRWGFFFLDGHSVDDAIGFANQVNVYPHVRVRQQ